MSPLLSPDLGCPRCGKLTDEIRGKSCDGQDLREDWGQACSFCAGPAILSETRELRGTLHEFWCPVVIAHIGPEGRA